MPQPSKATTADTDALRDYTSPNPNHANPLKRVQTIQGVPSPARPKRPKGPEGVSPRKSKNPRTDNQAPPAPQHTRHQPAPPPVPQTPRNQGWTITENRGGRYRYTTPESARRMTNIASANPFSALQADKSDVFSNTTDESRASTTTMGTPASETHAESSKTESTALPKAKLTNPIPSPEPIITQNLEHQATPHQANHPRDDHPESPLATRNHFNEPLLLDLMPTKARETAMDQAPPTQPPPTHTIQAKPSTRPVAAASNAPDEEQHNTRTDEANHIPSPNQDSSDLPIPAISADAPLPPTCVHTPNPSPEARNLGEEHSSLDDYEKARSQLGAHPDTDGTALTSWTLDGSQLGANDASNHLLNGKGNLMTKKTPPRPASPTPHGDGIQTENKDESQRPEHGPPKRTSVKAWSMRRRAANPSNTDDDPFLTPNETRFSFNPLPPLSAPFTFQSRPPQMTQPDNAKNTLPYPSQHLRLSRVPEEQTESNSGTPHHPTDSMDVREDRTRQWPRPEPAHGLYTTAEGPPSATTGPAAWSTPFQSVHHFPPSHAAEWPALPTLTAPARPTPSAPRPTPPSQSHTNAQKPAHHMSNIPTTYTPHTHPPQVLPTTLEYPWFPPYDPKDPNWDMKKGTRTSDSGTTYGAPEPGSPFPKIALARPVLDGIHTSQIERLRALPHVVMARPVKPDYNPTKPNEGATRVRTALGKIIDISRVEVWVPLPAQTVPPARNTRPSDDRDRLPWSVPVVTESAELRDALLAIGCLSTDPDAVWFSPLVDPIPSYLFTVDGLDLDDSHAATLVVRELIAGVLTSPQVVDKTAQHMRSPNREEAKRALASTRVDVISFPDLHKKPAWAWNVYWTPLDMDMDSFILWNGWVRQLSFLHHMAGTALVRNHKRQFTCALCKGLDHPTAACPSTKVTGWQGKKATEESAPLSIPALLAKQDQQDKPHHGERRGRGRGNGRYAKRR